MMLGGWGGVLRSKSYWGCAAGWGRIFTTELTISSRVIEWGRTFSGYSGMVSRDLKIGRFAAKSD